MAKPIKITEVVLRDAHQSLLATRMTMDEMRPILAEMDKIPYFSVECWGGATFDSCIRFLGEDPVHIRINLFLSFIQQRVHTLHAREIRVRRHVVRHAYHEARAPLLHAHDFAHVAVVLFVRAGFAAHVDGRYAALQAALGQVGLAAAAAAKGIT